MKLILANKAYSSWSFRPWLMMKMMGLNFKERVIPMYLETTAEEIGKYSDTGKLPVLIDGDVKIWESLAIIEYLNEIHPVWPKKASRRAHARAISNEMHAGFMAMRDLLTCNFRRKPKPLALTPAVQKDIDRVIVIWREARAMAKKGDFLYGKFTAADAMYAPVVARLHSYAVPVPDDIRAYMNAMIALPAWKEWEYAGEKEPWHYDFYERD